MKFRRAAPPPTGGAVRADESSLLKTLAWLALAKRRSAASFLACAPYPPLTAARARHVLTVHRAPTTQRRPM
jgi:hypothetical protein